MSVTAGDALHEVDEAGAVNCAARNVRRRIKASKEGRFIEIQFGRIDAVLELKAMLCRKRPLFLPDFAAENQMAIRKAAATRSVQLWVIQVNSTTSILFFARDEWFPVPQNQRTPGSQWRL